MEKIKVTYNGNMATTAICAKSPITLHTDGSAQSHAEGTAYTPVDMLVSSLGACMLSMMGFMASKKDFSIDGATASISYTQDESTHRVETISVTFGFEGITLGDAEKKILSAAAKACPVGASLHPDIKKELTFNF